MQINDILANLATESAPVQAASADEGESKMVLSVIRDEFKARMLADKDGSKTKQLCQEYRAALPEFLSQLDGVMDKLEVPKDHPNRALAKEKLPAALEALCQALELTPALVQKYADVE